MDVLADEEIAAQYSNRVILIFVKVLYGWLYPLFAIVIVIIVLAIFVLILGFS